METVRVSLALYALFGALTLARGVAGLRGGPTLSMLLLAAGGLGMFVVSAVGVSLPRERLVEAPPAWAILTSTAGIVCFTAGVGFEVL